jgi:dTDP-4-dehydrorhamnose reductase
MVIFVTGITGMLGKDIETQALKNGFLVKGIGSQDLDIADRDEVENYFFNFKPQAIIHSAAFTDVDGCEKNREQAYKVNVIGTKNLAGISAKLDVPFIFISTDYVFDGKKAEAYQEHDEPNPESYYGYTKFLAEEYILKNLRSFYIVRTSWLFGRGGKNFVKTILCLADESNELTVVNDQQGSPTYTQDLAEALIELIYKKPPYGIYHVTNSGVCSWYEFAQEICRQAAIDVSIRPITSEEYKRPARRPANSVLDNKRLREEGLTPLRDYKEALNEFLAEEGWIKDNTKYK